MEDKVLIDTNKAPGPFPSPLGVLTYKRLREMLMDLEWIDGGRLPPEEQLARGLGVSRRTLRGALKRLKEEGLIVSRRGSGNYVNKGGLDKGVSSSPIQFDALSIRSMADLQACIRFRGVIEVAAAGDAAANADLRAIAALEAALERYRVALPGDDQFDADFALHFAIAQASGNAFFTATVQGLKGPLRMGYDFSRRMRRVPLNERFRVTEEHAKIVFAIKSKDVLKAREAMEAHITATINRLFGG